jgi:hypothetical protein
MHANGGWRVTRTELDGSITIIADTCNGKKLNSPNDVAVACKAFADMPEASITGDQQRNRMYICGSTSLYAVYTSVHASGPTCSAEVAEEADGIARRSK